MVSTCAGHSWSHRERLARSCSVHRETQVSHGMSAASGLVHSGSELPVPGSLTAWWAWGCCSGLTGALGGWGAPQPALTDDRQLLCQARALGNVSSE